jgi:hypothetical protein
LAGSRYENLVVRKPNMIGEGGRAIPIDRIPFRKERPSTGPVIIMSQNLIKDSNAVIEYGIVWREGVAGNGQPGNFAPHKHAGYDEIFCFLGMDYQNPHDLGADAEFWLGEDDQLDKIDISTSACVYVPAGLAHFPLFWKNVRRPLMFVVVICGGFERDNYLKTVVPASLAGRPQ